MDMRLSHYHWAQLTGRLTQEVIVLPLWFVEVIISPLFFFLQEDCIARYKLLVELVQKKKQAKS